MNITWAATMRADQGMRLPPEVWKRCKQSGLRRLLVGVESGSNEVLKRIRKDIKIEQVFETAEKMRESGHRRPFSVHRRLPGRERRDVEASLDCAKTLRSMSPRLPDADLLLQALSGQRAGHRGGRARLSAAGDARGLVEFDYVAGEPGPWVSAEKFELIERFKFFHELAWKHGVARRRRCCSGSRAIAATADDYRWPVEMLFTRWLVPAQKLS